MITSHPQGWQTGRYSRISNPRLPLTRDALYARIHGATNPPLPIRNPLSGAGGGGIFSRIAAWLRGER